MKQRHRQIAHILGSEREPLDQAGATHHRHRVREPHRLGITTGARGKDHRHRVGTADLARRQGARRRHRVAIFGAIDIHNGDAGQVQTVEQP